MSCKLVDDQVPDRTSPGSTSGASSLRARALRLGESAHSDEVDQAGFLKLLVRVDDLVAIAVKLPDPHAEQPPVVIAGHRMRRARRRLEDVLLLSRARPNGG